MEWTPDACDLVSTRLTLPFGSGFNDPANPCEDDIVITGGTTRARHSTIAVNGDGGTATYTIKRAFDLRLNGAYEPGTGFTVEPVAHNSRALTAHSKLDVEVWKLDAGSVATGSDLCTTTEVTMTSVTTPTQQSFAVDGTGLVVGDRIRVIVSLNLNDTAAPGASADVYGFLDRVDMVGSAGGGLKWVE